jgi:hypothetical protein
MLLVFFHHLTRMAVLYTNSLYNSSLSATTTALLAVLAATATAAPAENMKVRHSLPLAPETKNG